MLTKGFVLWLILLAGLVTHGLLTGNVVDENYEQVLSFVTFEMFKRLQNNDNTESDKVEDPAKIQLVQEVSDLREDGSTFQMERALLKMFDSTLGKENFIGCDLEKCTEDSKLKIINRIECIRNVHNIRSILARQCYIGVVGVQDSG